MQGMRYAAIDRLKGYRFGSDGSAWSCRLIGRNGSKPRLGDQWKRLTPRKNAWGYLVVSIRTGDRPWSVPCLLHRLVLEAFSGPCPEGMEARHFPDTDPSNCRLENLSWDTHSVNERDKIYRGRNGNWGTDNPNSKLTQEQINEILSSKDTVYQRNKLAVMFNVHPHTIYRARKKYSITDSV